MNSAPLFPSAPRTRRPWVVDLLLVVVLLVAAYFRFIGINWGEYNYLHPDERFLIWVGTDISPVNSLADYFNTATSTLNPANVGHGFYVYGTLPMFLTRYLVQGIYGHSGFNEMTDIGRALSAGFDVLTVFLVYLVAERLYGRRAGLLSAAFAALMVLPIQQSHYFTMDTFINFFTFLAVYIAVIVATMAWDRRQSAVGSGQWGEKTGIESDQRIAIGDQASLESDQGSGKGDQGVPDRQSLDPSTVNHPSEIRNQKFLHPSESRRSSGIFILHPLFLPSLFFGISLGCAVASKLSAAPVAIMLPGAMLVHIFSRPSNEREEQAWKALPYLVMAAIVSLVVFRIFQPYAFSGPGFLGIKPNPQWVATIKELQAGSAGDIDYPFALQWARRPLWFSGKNMVLWGLGLPLGILAWSGFLWMGWRIIKGEWKRHLLLWGWAAFYFTWQSLAFNPTMRYQYPVYPVLGVIAGWAVVALYERGRKASLHPSSFRPDALYRHHPWSFSAVLIGASVLLLTGAWAFAFTRIYTNPITRVAASRWIYQNIPGPVDLHIQTGSGVYNQPLYYPNGYNVLSGRPYLAAFTAHTGGVLSEVDLGSIADQSLHPGPTQMELTISYLPGGQQPLAVTQFSKDLSLQGDPNQTLTIPLDQVVRLNFGKTYYLSLDVQDATSNFTINGPVSLSIHSGNDQISEQLPYPVPSLQPGRPFYTNFTAQADGALDQVYLANLVDQTGAPGDKTLTVQISDPGAPDPLASAELTSPLAASPDPLQQSYSLKLNRPVTLKKGVNYMLMLRLDSDSGAVTLRGMGVANESDFDDALPLRMDGYDSIYPRGLNFQMYWDENPEKVDRFLNMMQQSDYIVFSSNRQWGSIPRIPERYPMSSIYYRDLLGCPADQDLQKCYINAQPGMYQGKLGYDLVQVFESDPGIGPIQINDQGAEEAFTVYDHPKVFIFKKNAAFNLAQVQADLSQVDFSRVIRLTPKKAAWHPADLLLPVYRWVQQQEGGTWSQLFDSNALQNRFEILGVILWYACLSLLGLLVYPLVRLALPGLSDHGYPLARLSGLLLFAYLSWMAGSLSIPVTRLTLLIVYLLIAVLGLALGFKYRGELRREWQTRKRYFLIIEGLFLAFFLFDLLIRYGNPDLWHQNFGGEKPMDFSYFNAVLKSTTFPPYDPWFAGGYLNYYYYGFVLVGMLVKLLGIVPAFAYNLIIPTVFSLIAMGAFSVAWNIFVKDEGGRRKDEGDHPGSAMSDQRFATGDPGFEISDQGQGTRDQDGKPRVAIGEKRLAIGDRGMDGDQRSEMNDQRPATGELGSHVSHANADYETIRLPNNETLQPQSEISDQKTEIRNLKSEIINLQSLLVGLSGALMMAVFGNLGTVRMIYRGWQMLAAPGGVIDNASIPTRLVWAARGAFIALSGKPLPYYLGDWYWIPSRINPPTSDITEFPFFTVLYADPHAHLFAMPVALLALAWAVSVVKSRGRWQGWGSLVAGFLLGGLAIGALYPINLSDIYTYLPLGVVALGYALLRYLDVSKIARKLSMSETGKRLAIAAVAILALAALAYLLYEPYRLWYGQAYNSVQQWKGWHTPTWSYLTHWGLFLFIMVTWMAWETREWLANTPLSSLRKLEPYRDVILAAVVVLVIATAALLYAGIHIAWIVLPLAAWAGVLLFRPGLPDSKRIVLFLIGTGLMITLMVEIVVVKGDVDRMNTIFKFYLQAWTLFAVACAAAVGWMLAAVPGWSRNWRLSWQIPLALLVFSAALFTLLGGEAKVKDRMVASAPHTLDGMAYMQYAHYGTNGVDMDLSQDYNAIRWMQENVPGSPVIVEAKTNALYQWYTRFTIYTGLPGPIGWVWHEQQQRALLNFDWPGQRLQEVNEFYQTTDPDAAHAFLQKYDARYIIVGQLEKATYAGPGLSKFPALEGVLWRTVYHDKDTTIYEVIK